MTLLRTIDTACRVDQLLLTRKEGVAFRADIDAQLLVGRTGGEGLTACAMNLDVRVSGANVSFQKFLETRMLGDSEP